MKTYIFEKRTYFDRPRDVIFSFFSNAENLNKVTPKKLHFKILTDLPISMKKGTLIDYKLRIYYIPIHWRTEIKEWNPPHQFIDIQLIGPYRKWIHMHQFIAQENGTVMIDRVKYAIPGGFLVPLFHKLIVKKDIEKIFEYREKKFKEFFKKD